jgi:predicted ATPase
MITSLHIKNYRNLQDLSISSLGRVNLFTGKNNTGKTSILEAIAIYVSIGNMQVIYDILKERGELIQHTGTNDNAVDANLQMLSSLFPNRGVILGIQNAIKIMAEAEDCPTYALMMSFMFDGDNDTMLRRRGFLKFEICMDSLAKIDANDASKISYYLGSSLFSVNDFIVSLERDMPSSLQFIHTRNIDRNINSKLWDKIALTEKEQYVIDALKIIEPTTERIAFVSDGSSAKVKLSNNPLPIPIRSMGDGINRILTVILALVNASDGYLLIDEFENGLHYSVQEQLWQIIFELSEKLNVQVFATTHSQDSISSFETILNLNSSANKDNGQLIRLDNVNGIIKQVAFDADELRIATENNIEIR